MRELLFLLGVVLATAGVAFISWHVALIAFGLFLAFVAVKLGEDTVTSPDGKLFNSAKTDFNIN